MSGFENKHEISSLFQFTVLKEANELPAFIILCCKLRMQTLQKTVIAVCFSLIPDLSTGE